MNSAARTYVTLLLAFTCSSISAQKDSIGYVPKLNLIKVGVTSGILSIVSLNYERVLNPNISVAFTASYMVPLQPSGFFDIHPKNLTVSSDRQITGYYFTPEIKWFLETSDKRPAPRGFYLGGYLRFSDTRYTSSITAVATGDNASGSVSQYQLAFADRQV